MKMRISPCRVIVFQFVILLVFSLPVAAQEVVWPVRWAGLGDAKNGSLKWNRQQKKWLLQDAQGIEHSPVDVQAISPAKQPQRTQSQFISAGVATALFSYQESLTGRLESISNNRVVRWKFFGQEMKTPLDLGSAWVMNPGSIALISEDFESISETRRNDTGNFIEEVSNSPAGSHVLRLQKPIRLPLSQAMRTVADGTLFQVAFLVERKIDQTYLSIQFQKTGNVNENKNVQLSFDGKAGNFNLKYDNAAGTGPFVGTISDGWHWFQIELKPGRTRFCVDHHVISEMKSAWLGADEIQALTISGDQTTPVTIDGPGLYQFAEIPAPVQRPLMTDMIQVSGGHEWYGEFQSMNHGQLKFHAIENISISAGLLHTILPSRGSTVGQWVSGPVARVRFLHGLKSSWNEPDASFLGKLGLINQPPAGESLVEGVILDMNEKELVLGLSQGGSLAIPADRWTEIKAVGASGLRVLDCRPHHLGDEVDMKVIPFEPEGKKMAISFQSSADEANYSARLAVDILEVLGTNIQPFVDSLKKGELITEVWLNGRKIDNLNNYVIDRNDKPTRIYLEIPKNLMKNGENLLEFRQIGLQSDPDYLDDLSILGVRLYRID